MFRSFLCSSQFSHCVGSTLSCAATTSALRGEGGVSTVNSADVRWMNVRVGRTSRVLITWGRVAEEKPMHRLQSLCLKKTPHVEPSNNIREAGGGEKAKKTHFKAFVEKRHHTSSRPATNAPANANSSNYRTQLSVPPTI